MDAERMVEESFGGEEDKSKYIARLCKVLDVLHEKRFGFASGPCDCVCGDNTKTTTWRSTGDALAWLEALVDKMPETRRKMVITETYEINQWGDFSYYPPRFGEK